MGATVASLPAFVRKLCRSARNVWYDLKDRRNTSGRCLESSVYMAQDEWEPTEYTGTRPDLWPYVPLGTGRVLDVGCAMGEVGAALKEQGRAGEVVGWELSPKAATQARCRLGAVIEGDVEAVAAPYPDGYFDLLLYADVLEHLKNPWTLVARHRRLLRPGGHVVASLPNVGHYSTLLMLLRQQWRYEELGTMDRTHLRFFTRPGVLDLFRRAGYGEIRLYRRGGEGPKQRLARALSLGYSTDFFIPGFVCVGRTPGR